MEARVDDIFEMYAQLLLQGFVPDTMLVHPMAWLMWVKDPVLREFAIQSGGGAFFAQFTGNAAGAESSKKPSFSLLPASPPYLHLAAARSRPNLLLPASRLLDLPRPPRPNPVFSRPLHRKTVYAKTSEFSPADSASSCRPHLPTPPIPHPVFCSALRRFTAFLLPPPRRAKRAGTKSFRSVTEQ